LLNSRKLTQNRFLTRPTQLTLDTQQQSVSRTHNINSSSAQKSEQYFTLTKHISITKISTRMRAFAWLQWAVYSRAADTSKNVCNLQCITLFGTGEFTESS